MYGLYKILMPLSTAGAIYAGSLSTVACGDFLAGPMAPIIG